MLLDRTDRLGVATVNISPSHSEEVLLYTCVDKKIQKQRSNVLKEEQ
jgi:hypothetical protein